MNMGMVCSELFMSMRVPRLNREGRLGITVPGMQYKWLAVTGQQVAF